MLPEGRGYPIAGCVESIEMPLPLSSWIRGGKITGDAEIPGVARLTLCTGMGNEEEETVHGNAPVRRHSPPKAVAVACQHRVPQIIADEPHTLACLKGRFTPPFRVPPDSGCSLRHAEKQEEQDGQNQGGEQYLDEGEPSGAEVHGGMFIHGREDDRAT